VAGNGELSGEVDCLRRIRLRDEQQHDATSLRSVLRPRETDRCAGVVSTLDHPAVQGGLAPLVAALMIAAIFARTRFAWLAILAAYATMVALSTGFSFSPLTVARKTILVGLIAPILGVVVDVVARGSKTLATALAIAAGAVSIWIFMTILKQRDTTAAIAIGGGVALFVAVLVGLMLRLRNDGLRAGAAGLGLGVATGIAGLLSASIGYLLAGVSIAAGAGALLLTQVLLSRKIAPGFTGTVTIGLLTALFAVGSVLLAQLPWYALPLLLLIPLGVTLRAPEQAPLVVRAAVLAAYALLAAALPILAAWFVPRGP
jgi:hypothetical protein